MTVIACRCIDNGCWELAADHWVWSTQNVKVGVARKIIRLPNGALFAATGKASEIMAVHAWLQIGKENKPTLSSEEGFQAILINATGVHVLGYDLVDENDQGCAAPYYAIGYQRTFCFALLVGGASAHDAVRLTLDHTDAGGGPVQVEYWHP